MRSGGEAVRLGRRRSLGRSFGSLLSTDRNTSYRKLSFDVHKLSILKLDGTSFDIEIARNAKVAELKQVIEDLFSFSADEGEESISWTHVWGHFCLCYAGQKLVSDKTHLRDLGIQDGDQASKGKIHFSEWLQFMQHITIARNSKTKQSKKEGTAFRGSQSERLSSRPHDYDSAEEDEDEIPEFKFVDFLRGWLPHSRLRSMSRRSSGSGIYSPRFGVSCMGMGSRPGAIRLGA